jgi:hypothetical protein
MVLAMSCQKVSVKPPVQVDFVRVGGRYRVGKLLGSGGSGRSNSNSNLIQLSELSMECLSRERYQDRGRNCFEDRVCRSRFKVQS